MAFFLGNESCIESLRNDLNDIQETIDEILVRNNGSIKCYSWKSPDKLATDLQIKELIERYKHGRDEVDNQVAHYSLLELIIDRLLLLIFISNNYAESSLQSASTDRQTTTNAKITRLSAGLCIKKYWNRFSQLNTAIRQLSSQSKASSVNQKIKQNEDLKASMNNLVMSTTNTKVSTHKQHGKLIADEVSSKGVQTMETSFVPCESCAKVQTNLKQNADQLINMCHYQNITSQVGKYRQSLMANQLVGGWLSGSDLEKWLAEQDKDLSKLAKQLEFLTKNNELLKAKMSDNEALMSKMSTAEKELKKTLKDEQEMRSITMKQYEKKLSDQRSELESKVKALECEMGNLNQLKLSLENKYECLKNLNDNNEKIITELTESSKSLNDELDNKKKVIHKLDEDKLVLSTECECLKRELNEKSAELIRERQKFDEVIRSEQSLKLKNESLLDSIDKLTAENEVLKRRLDNREEIHSKLDEKNEEIEQLRMEVDAHKRQVDQLSKEIKKSKENEMLLLKYPDLYGPIEQHVENENESNVCEDMINQISANKYRIGLLENLNKKLSNSIKKLNETQVMSNKASETDSYFMKQANQSDSARTLTPLRQSSMSKMVQDKHQQAERAQSATSAHILPVRPVPLFKLENELDRTNENLTQNELNFTSNSKKFWNQEDSLQTNLANRDTFKEPDWNEASIRSNLPTPTNRFDDYSMSQKNYNHKKNAFLDDDDEDLNEMMDEYENDNYDFLKEKHESDKNYLQKLNEINQASELRIENSSSQMKNNRRGLASRENSRQFTSPFLYSPSQSSMNSDRNPSRIASANGNKQNFRPNSSVTAHIPPIPPADKNMEVVVGKGRRLNSANLVSTRSNSSSSNQPRSSISTGQVKNGQTNFKCDNCEKKYNNIKDFDIHKLYCTKKLVST